ncbi:MAG: zinc-binding alcohol dehydrogenase family protein [Muribaculaceae bacterium]|nr:zinc-binding alcohol dehydrogenase family protein [Muribaculaceae bacterium]
MKTILIEGPGKVSVTERPKPELKADEVLVKIGYVGFCGSDLNTYLGKNQLAISPVVPGHEIGGVVEEIGADVPAGLFTKGMSVTVNPYTACGKCPPCRKRRPNTCRDNQTLGVQRHGAMSEYIAVPWQKIVAAEGLSVKECALIEPMSVGFHAVSRGEVTDLDTVMVIGCGMIGLGAIVRASLRGARVIAVDIDEKKLELAKSLGAAYGLDSTKEDFHDQLQQITCGDGPDVVIEAVGAPFTYNLAVNEVSFAGRVVCIGYSAQPVTFQTKLFVQKELDIRGSRNALPEDFEAVKRYLMRGECPVDALVSAIVRPEGAAEILEYWDSHRGDVFRILVDFN